MTSEGCRIRVGLASCGIAAGAAALFDALKRKLANSLVTVQPTGCLGMCYCEPLVEVVTPEGENYLYGNVTVDDVEGIVQHAGGGKPVEDLLVLSPTSSLEASQFLAKQTRFTLKNCGIINPEDIDDYLRVGGYQGLKKALTAMTPEEVIEVIERSGLRGR